MRSKKGPKVHQYSKKHRRPIRPGRAVLSVCFTFLIAGAIGFVGYSVAKPILQFTKTDSGESSQTEPATEQAAASQTEPATEISAAVTETEPATEVPDTQMFVLGYRLPEEALESESAFKEALTQARQAMPDGKILVVPLKKQGGEILYQTEISLAKQCGAASGTLTLAQITAAAGAQGWTPVAECDLLQDNLLPDADADAGYRVVSDGSRWLDNTKEKGGKAWVSPFSSVTQTYLSDLVKEIADAGFFEIWCTGVTFPNFRSSDLDYLGDQVKNADRAEALTDLLNQLGDAAGAVPVLLCANAQQAESGQAEAFRPDELEISGVVLDLEGSISDAAKTLEWASGQMPDAQLWLSAQTDVSGEMPDPAQEAVKSAAGWIWYAESGT